MRLQIDIVTRPCGLTRPVSFIALLHSFVHPVIYPSICEMAAAVSA